jgi:hypothetical protein
MIVSGVNGMMKKIFSFIFILLFLFIVSACSKQEGLIEQEELKRIDVQNSNEDEEIIIVDRETINTIKSSLDYVKWRPDVEPEMARKEDFTITLFHLFDKNLPERLYKYRVWFHTDDTAAIISENSTQGYGTLNKVYSEELKNALLKREEEKKSEEIIIFKLDKETKKIVISNKDAINTIKKALKSAIKQPGMVDMADPQYKINIGDEIYFLWLTRSDGTIGTIMNFKDTHTIYTLSEHTTKELKDILLTNN